ncbi:hypothetical protein [Sphingomonas sp.]|uniref:hypothetical protein n=1 Tax=Sphingomonas sp. TaxID=28214 RepID=UPI00307F59F5
MINALILKLLAITPKPVRSYIEHIRVRNARRRAHPTGGICLDCGAPARPGSFECDACWDERVTW